MDDIVNELLIESYEGLDQLDRDLVTLEHSPKQCRQSRVKATDALETQVHSRSIVSDSSLRVDVALLDRLMNLVGEPVLARNQILQHSSGNPGTTLRTPAQRLDLLTTELQEGVTKTRA